MAFSIRVRRCPSCGSEEVHRSRVHTREKTSLWRLGLASYFRCHACGWREARIAPSRRRLILIWMRVALVALILLVVIAALAAILTREPSPAQQPEQEPSSSGS